jgi:uncharacterized protein (DUF1697 family)
MHTHVALLKGINVGTAKRVAMAELKRLMTDDLGHAQVTTLLNSGNVVFHSAKAASAGLSRQLSSAIEGHFGFAVPVVVKASSELDAIVAGNPIAAAASDASRFLVAFTQEPDALQTLDGVAELLAPSEAFVVTPHAAYLHCPGGITDSKAGSALLGKKGLQVTTRNWATVLKIQAAAQALGGR